MRRLLPVVALTILAALTVVALAFSLGIGADSPAALTTTETAATSPVTEPAPLPFTTSAKGCTATLPVPHTGCVREGQCCHCPCDFVGTCDSVGGQLLCVCPCAQ